MHALPKLTGVLVAALIIAASLASCKAVSRTLGTSGTADVTPQRFIDAYEQPTHDDAYWAYIGRVGPYLYMEYYRTIDKTYPEFAGEIRVPIKAMPKSFPAAPQGTHHEGYVYPEPEPQEGAPE
jgi:hypothetical protein